MIKRYSFIENDPIHAIATLLDARYKADVFSSPTAVTAMKEALINKINSHGNTNGSDEDEPIAKKMKSNENDCQTFDLWSCMRTLDSGNPPQNEQTFNAMNILDEYLKQPRIPLEADYLEYWRSVNYTFKPLADQACHYLCPPPSSVSSERLFSCAGNVMTDKRNSLKAEKLDMLCFCKANLALFNFNY